VELPGGLQPAAAMPTALAAGDELVMAFRYNGAPTGDVKLTGTIDGQPHTVNFNLALPNSPGTQNRFVPGEWAAQRITALELDAADHEREIVRLSKRYGVLSRYTTLLALESKEMMDEFGVRKRNRTQWEGSEVADESTGADPADADAAPPRRPMKKSKSKRSRRAPKPSMNKSMSGDLGGFGGGGGFESSSDMLLGEVAEAEPMPRPAESRAKGASKPMPDGKKDSMLEAFEPSRPIAMPRRPHYRRHVRRVHVEPATATTSSERKNAERRRKQLKSDENNRTKRMRLIRSLVRAAQIDNARRETDDWLSMNPMDPEAIVQRAQLHALQGDVSRFYTRLLSAADAAPRGRWLQTRIAAAARAQGDEPVTCAMEVALESTAKSAPKAPRDILSCPMTTVIEPWFGGSGPAAITRTTDDKRLTGQAVIELSGSGDWDIMVLEPSGRPLWWGSQRRGIKVSNVVGATVTERLSIPRLQTGTYSVYAIPRAGNAGDSLMVKITGGGSGSYQITAGSAQPIEVAQIAFR
jgi:hypothetical protein